jgi:hypothetical protein
MAWEINAHQGRKVPIGEAEKAVIDLADAPKRRSQLRAYASGSSLAGASLILMSRERFGRRHKIISGRQPTCCSGLARATAGSSGRAAWGVLLVPTADREARRASEDDDRSRLLGQWVDAWRTVRVRCWPRSENGEQRDEIGCDA